MKTIVSRKALGLAGVVGVLCCILPASAGAEEPPRIQFETNFFDFGKITAPGEISGVFRFKNTGQGVLKLDPPMPSCGCTVSQVKPDKLGQGESGEISYTIKLDHAFMGQKSIKVHSNDPQAPDVQLTMQMDYQPLYEVVPKALRVTVLAGKESGEGTFKVMRTDGQPLHIERLSASQNWVSAALEGPSNPLESSAQVRVTVRRPPAASALMSAMVELWGTNQTGRPMQTVLVMGDMQGELTASPAQLYWVIPDLGNALSNYPPESLTHTIELKSVLGNPVEIKQATTTVKGLAVKVVPKDGGKLFDLVLHFDALPQAFAKGEVMVETSVASLPKLEVPLTIAVPAGK